MKRDTRAIDAKQRLTTADALIVDAMHRLDVMNVIGYRYAGEGKKDGLTPTQIVRTIDEARRLLLAARKELE